MKQGIVVLAMLSMVLVPNSWAQTTVGPLLNDYREYIAKTSAGSFFSSGLVESNTLLNIGRNQAGTRYRCFYQWSLPDNIVPDGANISKVKLEFGISRDTGPQTIGFKFAPIQSDITTEDIVTVFSETENPASSIEGHTSTNQFEQEYLQGQSPFPGWIVDQLGDDKFTLAIWLYTDYQFAYLHYLNSWTVKLTMWVAPQSVTADQVFENEVRIEGSAVELWQETEFASYEVPYEFEFDVNSVQTFRADTTLWENPQSGFQEKYRTWNGLADVLNHKDFVIRPGLSRVESQFKIANDATIQGYVIDAGSAGGSINFKDPWLRDSTDDKGPLNRGLQAIFHPVESATNNVGVNSPYRGVFLNQGSDWQPPYYSVGAPNPQTFTIGANNYTAYFQNWEENSNYLEYQNSSLPQTGVVFKSSGATATANYKLHLASNSASATASNTQRKVVRDGNGVYHAVYPSADLIWYTRSTNGTTWSPELLLNSPFLPPEAYHRSPSLTFVPGATAQSGYIIAVWEGYNQEDDARCVYYCQLDLDGNIVEGPESVDCWNSEEPAYSPVVGTARFNQSMGPGDEEEHDGASIDAGGPPSYYYYYPLILWYNPQWENSLRGIIKYGRYSWSNTGGLIGLSDVTVYSIAPFSYENGTWDIAYISGNDLYYAPVYVNSNFPTLGTPELVKEGDPMSVYVKNPSIARVGSTVGISWEEYYWEFVSGAVKYSQRAQADVWTNPVGWWPVTGYFRTPSLHGEPDKTNATIAWQDDGTTMYYVQGQPGQWSGVTSLGTGVGPVMSIGLGGAQAELVLSRGTTSPYVIQRQSISTSSRIGLSNPVVIAEGRGSNLAFRNGSLHIAVLDAQANEMRLGFAEMNDTARINLSQFENVFATEPFAGTGMLKLTTLFTAKGQLPNGINIRMTLRDAATGNVVQNLRTFHVGEDTLVTFQTALNHGNRQLKLVLQPIGVAQLSRINLERWFVVDEAASPAKQSAHATAPSGVPEVFAVHPNYPNPFNPSTTIKYDLPEASHVSLVVYDLLGRKVTELVNGPKAGGYHSATWNASSVASGVYFARFTAIPQSGTSGNVRLNTVSKLVLTK